MKRIIILSALIVATLQTIWAQGFRVYNSDGTVLQFSLRTDSIVFYDGIGSEQDLGLFTPVNQMIVGTWYKSKSESVTFNEDGTTDLEEAWGTSYEFFPFQGILIIYSTTRNRYLSFHVVKLTKDSMIMGSTGAAKIDVYTRTQPVQYVTSITLNETSLTLQPDEVKTLTATVFPEDADIKELIWESSNEDVAEVNGRGRIIANGVGTCVITCRAKDGSGVYAECSVTVMDVQFVTGITLSQTSLSLSLPSNTTKTLSATVLPTNATNRSITWSSSNTSVATVNQNGKITAVAAGSCTITATAADGSGVKAECFVTVTQLVTGITLSQTSLSLTLPDNTTKVLTATVQPANASNKNITWSSSNVNIASVDQNGKVTAVAEGSCTITCTATDGSGIKAECQVKVEDSTHGYTNGYEWVDLGLPSGTKWATCNVDASKPEEYGGYYAWGEISEKINYHFGTYTYNNVNNDSDIAGTDYDVAQTRMGAPWRMPSMAQQDELMQYCSHQWTKRNGVNGMLVTGPSGGKIFLPATGYRWDDGNSTVGYNGFYWSSSLCPNGSNRAYYLYIGSAGWDCGDDFGGSGRSVRAVCP